MRQTNLDRGLCALLRSRAPGARRLGSLLLPCCFMLCALSAHGAIRLRVALDEEMAAAEEAYLAADYEQVVALCTQLIEAGPGAHEAIFLRGMAYRKLNRHDKARHDLETYLKEGGYFAEEAREVLSQRHLTPKRESDFRMTLQGGVVYDTRVPVRRTDVDTGVGDQKDTGVRIQLSADYRSRGPLLLRYRGYGTDYFDSASQDRLRQTAEWGGRWTIANEQAQFEWTLIGESELVDYEEYLWRYGSKAELSWLLTENQVGWVSLEGGYSTFVEIPELDGVDGALGVGLEQYFSKLSLFWNGYVLKQEADLEELGFLEFGGGLLPHLRLSDRWTIGLYARGGYTEYDAFDELLGVPRQDTFFSGKLWISCALTEWMALVPSAEYFVSDSTASEADYDRSTLELSLVVSGW